MTHCVEIGWIADKQGYRYSQIDPLTQNPCKWDLRPMLALSISTKQAHA
ncbi:hypothetical protein [Ventosimonas gracilis]|nr:hypothetical protein [Ventosimonas gracilis]